MTVIEVLRWRMARKRALLDQIDQASEAGDQVEVERLWAEVDKLYEPGSPMTTG